MFRLRFSTTVLRVILVLCITSVFVNGIDYNDTETLYQNIFSSYVKELRPGWNQSEPLVVKVTLYLSSVAGFDELAGKLTTIGYFDLSWVDHRITWDPAMYGNRAQIILPEEKVWLPSIFLVNSHNSLVPLRTGELLYLTYLFNETSSWNPGGKFESICDTDPTYYPFDKQKCQLTFYTSGYDTSEVIYLRNNPAVVTSFYDPNGVWELTSIDCFTATYNNVPSIIFTVQIARKPAFFIVTLLLPIMLMGLLNVLVFLLPAASGERVGYSVTILLAFGVYLSILSVSLPTSANPEISIICYLLLSDLSMGSVIMFCTIFGLVLYDKEDTEPVPQFLVKFVTCLQSINCCRKRKIQDSENKAEFSKHEKIILEDVKNPEKMEDDKDSEQKDKPTVTWKQFARILDFIFIAFFVFWIFVSNVAYLCTVLR